MPFKQHFERKVNENMQEDLQEGRAPRQSEDQDMDLKKGFTTPQLPQDYDDDEKDEKLDAVHQLHERPPRFSTLFGARATPDHTAPAQYLEPPARRRRSSGVFMPMPLFILLVATIFFESTILFAYTVLGIYSSAGPRLFGIANGAAACQATPQPYVNISPNFVLPQAQAAQPAAVTIHPLLGDGGAAGTAPDGWTVFATSSSTSSTSTSTSSANSTSSSAPGVATVVVTASFSRAISTSTTEATVVVQAPPTVTSVVIATGPPPAARRALTAGPAEHRGEPQKRAGADRATLPAVSAATPTP